jgi:hypothetical protein
LSIPREYASIGDVYSYNGKEASVFGNLTDLLEPQFEIPQIRPGEVMADIYGKISRGVSLSFGMKFLGGFLKVFGASSIINTIQAGYESKATRFVKFSFSNVTRDSVNVNLVRRKMSGHKVVDGEGVDDDNNKNGQYYVVTAVIKSPSINISAEDANNRSLAVNIEAAGIADASAKVSVEKAREGEITYKGDKSIAFGVELYQLDYDNVNRSFKFHEVTSTVFIRNEENKETPIVQNNVIEPALIKDPEKGEDGFLTIL